MSRIRRDVGTLDDPWDPPVLWYARGVKALKARDSIGDVTSWRYLAAMHGVWEEWWRATGWLRDDEELPNTGEFAEDRDQCQHHNWYFLPWHRGYVRAFERIVHAAVVQLGGPEDWALPYWNYSAADDRSRVFPLAFGGVDWPDGDGDNPLFEERRYGKGDGTFHIRAVDVALDEALGELRFEGVSDGGSPGFGGAATPFQHNADRRAEGLLEQGPHDVVHGRIGGVKDGDDTDPLNLGLMSHPGLAALDPIFWIHHANIDRLWEVWLKRDAGHQNPTQDSWLKGPLAGRRFAMPEPDGGRSRFVAEQMLDTTVPALDYEYEDTSDPLGGATRRGVRLQNLGFRIPGVQSVNGSKPAVELLGATVDPVRLVGSGVGARVWIDAKTRDRMLESFSAASFPTRRHAEPDRVFLNLENITGSNDAAVFDVYVGLAEGDEPSDHPDRLAGVVSLFGVSDASTMRNPHGGNGLNKVIEITATVDRLQMAGADTLAELPIRFVASGTLGTRGIEIGRVSVYRQTA